MNIENKQVCRNVLIIAAALRKLNVEVDIRLNAGKAKFGAALDGYTRNLAANPAHESFFWYAGHGIQCGYRNYLLPVDAGVESERTLQRDAHSLDELLANQEEARNKVHVVALDARRNNPLPSSSRGAREKRGLAVIQDVPGDLFMMFSTAPGDVADGGKGNRNSPCTEAFLKHIDSGEPLSLMATDVIHESMRLTNYIQRPVSRAGGGGSV
ncbi:MAG: caspase family protein, partial [Treponema sp.]|nr:caspase family protein [Treponema sp.]